MPEMTREQIEKMSMDEIRTFFRNMATREATHQAITWEVGTDIVNVVAIHGERIADRLTN